MICVTVFVDSKHHYQGIHLLGHAGSVEDYKEGQELDCAAVSAQTLNNANSVEQFTEDSFEAEEGEDEGEFSFRFTSEVSSESRLLMNALVFGLQNIEEDYGEPYIKIRFKEV